MEHVLLLNITYEPLRIINWKKAITLLCLGKVEVIEEYTREIHSVTFTLKLPSVVRLLRMVKRPKTPVKFSRQNIYARDRYRCQYCGNQYPTEELTYDHVMPKSRGGTTEWENIVTCCIDCNRKKGGRNPSEASMQLRALGVEGLANAGDGLGAGEPASVRVHAELPQLFELRQTEIFRLYPGQRPPPHAKFCPIQRH